MSITNSANMTLPIPGVGTEQGPNYAFDINSSLTLIDQHDHSLGRGVQITPAGMNINTDLDFQTNLALNIGTAVFTPQSIASPLLQSLSVAPGTESPTAIQDLWYTNSAGVAVQITAGNTLSAPAAAIDGESYAFGTFYWKQGAGSLVPANFDIGSITIRPNISATAYGIVISPPAAIASQYDIVLPLLPAAGPTTSPAFLSIDSSGNMDASIPRAKGIDTSMIADDAITTVKILDGNVTAAKLSSSAVNLNSQTFTANGSFTVPAGITEVIVEACGGGGGGAGGGHSSGAGSGTSGSVPGGTGGNTTFSTDMTAFGGLGGAGVPENGSGAGGAVLSRFNSYGTGGVGAAAVSSNAQAGFYQPSHIGGTAGAGVAGGGGGGAGAFGAGGAGGTGAPGTGGTAVANTGGGGGGGKGGSGTNGGGGGGGEGGQHVIRVITVVPLSVKAITIGGGGAGSAGGIGGTPGAAGGAGGSGFLKVTWSAKA